MTDMTDKEIERLAELIAIKTSESYFKIIKEHIQTQIMLHAANCAANKYSFWKQFFSAIIGGIVVGLIMWKLTSP